ncbi:MAG: hypothetical protein SH868_02605 [Bythopirellula sp.]|nr:hypothetical protein [Bythopirellula sp.]
MKFKAFLCCICLVLAPIARGEESATALDLRRAAPPEAFLAVYGKHNPERDYQREYLAKVWQTVQDEKIGERILKIVTARMPAEDLDGAQKVIDELRGAIDPSLDGTVLDCEEILYVQTMQFPTSHHLVLLRYPAGVAEKVEASCQNLLTLLEQKSEGKVPVTRINQGDVEITGLGFPPEVPMQPAFARVGDIFLVSSSQVLLSQSLEMLKNGSGVSKFDDPRFAEAIAALPKAEDAIAIFDGQQLFKQLGTMSDFIRQQGKDNPDVERVAETIELVIDELAVFDFEVSVEYTEGHENRVAALGKIAAGADQKLLGKALVGGVAFADWQKWIPAEAVAYSLSKGVQLHPVYERVMEILQTKFPETKQGLEKFAKAQEDLDLHLDRDILQSFSGESVSVTLPRADQGQDTVFALKCTNPDRIRELLHRFVDNLQKFPALETQQINLAEIESLAGFETLNVAMLAAFNVKPVIGFNEGWMMIGSNPACVQKILDARAGKTPTIDGAEHFERFHLPVEGAVDSLSFTDLEKSIHHVADMIRKVGGIAPMFLAMAGANANAEEMKPLIEALAILPSVANVVEKFDFYQANLTVIQAGPLPDSYLKQSVTLIRPPLVATK